MNPAFRPIVWAPWIIVLALLAALTALTLSVNRGITARNECRERLQSIYLALQTYDRQNDRLPRLAFYPRNPRTGSDSLLMALRSYGLGDLACQCPHSPRLIREKHGLTYVWNVALNDRSLRNTDPGVWVLVEISALSDAVRPPHFGKYNVLFANGEVRSMKTAPEGVRSTIL